MGVIKVNVEIRRYQLLGTVNSEGKIEESQESLEDTYSETISDFLLGVETPRQQAISRTVRKIIALNRAEESRVKKLAEAGEENIPMRKWVVSNVKQIN